jgi:hypothetical protein
LFEALQLVLFGVVCGLGGESGVVLGDKGLGLFEGFGEEDVFG